MRSRYPETVLPEGPAPLPRPRPQPRPPVPEHSETPLPDPEPKLFRGEPNAFGLVREYRGGIPLHDPDNYVPLSELDSLNAELDAVTPSVCRPYPNLSSARLGNWWLGQGTKSIADLNVLVKDVIGADDFVKEDVVRTPFAAIFRELGADGAGKTFDTPDGWRTSEVPVRVPFGDRNRPPRIFSVPNLLHRPLLEVIRTVCESERAKRFHFHPYRLIWQPGQGAPEQCIHGEFYTSKEFLDAYDELQRRMPEDGCDLPRAIIALFFASDSTHLAQFGTASLWPAYLMFGNESKYTRGRPSACACHHIAYFPKVGFFVP